MARGLRALLSPNEELTLHRVALGIALARDLSAANLQRLRNLGLIEDRGDRFVLTALGRERHDHLHETIDMTIDDDSNVARSVRAFAKDTRK
jgi:hypothetical protein